MMKQATSIYMGLTAIVAGVPTATAFQPSHPLTRRTTSSPNTPHQRHPTSLYNNYIDLSESSPRDVDTMISWAQSYGIQHNFDICPTSSYKQLKDANDRTCYALSDLPAGTPILSVPSSVLLHSLNIKYNEVGELERAEQFLRKLREPLPLFYLYVKLLYEYSLGDTSPYYDWLNSLPREYDTGTSMTPVCYECLPPLAANYAKTERVRYINYQSAAKTIEWLPEWILEDRLICKWVFNVVSTRNWELKDGGQEEGSGGGGGGERVICPLGDMVSRLFVCLFIDMHIDVNTMNNLLIYWH